MAFDKVKTLNAAEKYLELGKIPAAIREYCAIVEHEPDDFTTLNMLGDLYVRVNNHAAAISCFRTIAEHYREQDFVLKAIAMFKKIDRLQPNDPEIALNLADLYAQQQLVVDARAHYWIVAENYKNAGASLEGLEVLRKIANLDPQNTDVRLKLAEGYLKQNMKEDAAAAFTEAGQHLLGRAAFDEAVKVFSRTLEICSADHAALKGLLAAHIGRGTAKEAVEILHGVSADNADDVVLPLLIRACVEADDAPGAERAATALVAKLPSEYLKYVDVARLYLKQNNVSDAVRLVETITDRMVADREDSLLLALLDEMLMLDADNIEAQRLLIRVYWWQRDTDKLRPALERLAKVAQAANLADDERYALTQLTRLAPECAEYLERLEQLGGALEEATNESFSPPEAGASTTIESDQFTFEQTDATPVGESEFEWNSVADVTEDWVEPAFTFDSVVAEELSVTPAAAAVETTNDSDEERKSSFRTQELESVDFYIAQGYVDIAHDTLNLLEQQFGPHADIEMRRQKLNATAPPQPANDPALLASIENNIEPASLKPLEIVNEPQSNGNSGSLPSSPSAIDAGLAEIFEEYRVSAEAEVDSAANGDYETHYNLGLAYKEMDLFEEALEEFQIAIKMVGSGDGTGRYLQCCNLLGHCFLQKGVPQAGISWFQKGLNSPDASEEERQALRFELGSAYEQLGDLKRALDLFTEVYGNNVTYRGVKDRMRTLQARIANENGDAVPQLPAVQAPEQLLN